MDNTTDVINKPPHYTHGKAETWNLYEVGLSDEEFRGAMKSNIWKYTYRAGHKGSTVEDLQKAIAYLKRWIIFEQGVRNSIVQSDIHAPVGYSLNQRYGDEPYEVSAEDWDKLAKKVYAKEWKEIHPDDNFQPKESWWTRITDWIREKVLWIQN